VGGPGSGRRQGYRRTTAEECERLSISTVKKALAHGPGWRGSVSWTSRGRPCGSLVYETVKAGPYGLGVRLLYRFTDGPGDPESLDYTVELTRTPCHYGGHRWWFVCGASRGGVYCGRRCAKLYRPPGAKYFACRECYDLTYASCQDSHKYDRLFARLAADCDLPVNVVKRGLKRRYGRG
jgi:hypothetical protein